MDTTTVNAYNTAAAEFAARYAGADVTGMRRLLLHYLPPTCRVLEIGCGSGRDATFLAENGFRVVATDASVAMLDQFRHAPHYDILVADYPSPPAYLPTVELFPAAFPLPPDNPLLQQKFDAVIGLAVLTHLPDQELFEFTYQVRQLLKPGGTVILSVSEGRDLTAESRDEQGRLFRERPAAEIALLFERLGFHLLARETTADGLGRDAIRWTTLVLRLDAATGTRPVDQIETIINRDKKTATYKLALLRALCEIAQIRGQGKKDLEAFRADMNALLGDFRNVGGLDAFHTAYRNNQLSPHQRCLADAALNKIAHTIVVGPVAFSGGALEGSDNFFTHSGRRTATKVNGQKSDRIVTRATLRASEERIIHYWQETRRQETFRFDCEISRTLLGRNAPETQWEKPAFAALLDAAEMVAIQRGVERWDAPSAHSSTMRTPLPFGASHPTIRPTPPSSSRSLSTPIPSSAPISPNSPEFC